MEIGDRVGPYEIRSFLASGGMAQVFKVWNTGLTRHEAMKIPFEHLMHDPIFARQFLDGARFAARLHHEHIATIYAVSEENAERHFFTMELIEGNDLAGLLREEKLSVETSLCILDGVAQALDFAHENGIVHRDIKPPNVLLEKRGGGIIQPKVVDFGIARAMEDSGGTRMTRSGSIMGTPEYMSPEQAGSGATVGPPTDIYSLGVMTFQMLCGETPFALSEGTSPMAILVKHLHTPPPAPSSFNPELSPAVDALILRCLAKDPTERPASCAAFIKELEQTLKEPPQVTIASPGFSTLSQPLTANPPAATSTPPAMTQTAPQIPVTPAPAPPAITSPTPKRSYAILFLIIPLLIILPLSMGAAYLGWVSKGHFLAQPTPTPEVVATPEPEPTATPKIEATPEEVATAAPKVDTSKEKAAEAAKKARGILNRIAAQTEILESKIQAQQITFSEFDRQDKLLRAQTQQALDKARTAMALDKNNEDAWLQRCRALYYLGNFSEAAKLIQQAKTRFPGTDEFALLETKVKTAQQTTR